MRRASMHLVLFLFTGLLLTGLAVRAQNSVQPVTQSPKTLQIVQPSHTQRVMAPPLETRAATKLRPSTAGGGMIRNAKPPLKALPALSATGADEKTQTTASLSHSGHWLLVYRTNHCVACDRVMNVLAASTSPDLRSGVPYSIIVGGKSPTAMKDVRSSYGTLASANWLADRDRSVFSALQLRGVPEVIAMDGDRVAWKIAGNLGDPQQVLRLTDGWIAGTAATDAATKEKTTAAAKTSSTAATSTPPSGKR